MKRPTLSWLGPPVVAIAAVLSGLLLAAAYPPLSLGSVAFVALVPVLAAIKSTPMGRGGAFRAGYLFGCTFFFFHLHWIVRLVPASSITFPWLMFPALVLLVAYLSVYPGLFAMLWSWLGRDHALSSILLAPAAWTLVEIFRSTGELGFPWGAIGYSLSRQPGLVQSAAFVGVYGLGAFIVLVNAVWALALVEREWRKRILLVLAGAVLFVTNALLGARAVDRFASPRADAEGGAVTTVVQPNVDLALKWKPEFRDSTFALIERLTREAATAESDLVVFPETCAPIYIAHHLPYRQRLFDIARETGVPVFIGFLDGRRQDGVAKTYNSSGLFDPEGTLTQYEKMHLLPFGEAIPFSWKFRGLRKIDFGQANFYAGTRDEPVASDVGALAPMICFESIFPDLARNFVRKGADYLVNITNDGWFGTTPGPLQHNDMAILRAVENRRYLLRSANSGISMIVDPAGRVVASLGLGKEALLSKTVHPVDEVTIYTRVGEWPLVVGSLLLIALGWLNRRRRRGGVSS